MPNFGVGISELVIVSFILLWQIGLPLAVVYVIFRLWQRLRTIEQTLETLRVELQQKR